MTVQLWRCNKKCVHYIYFFTFLAASKGIRVLARVRWDAAGLKESPAWRDAFSRGSTQTLSCATHPTNARSLQMWHCLRGEETGFPTIQDSIPRSIVTTKK